MMTEEELINLIETKAPEELTRNEIAQLHAAMPKSAALRQALAQRLEMEQFLVAALDNYRITADQVLARAGRCRDRVRRTCGRYLAGPWVCSWAWASGWR